MSVLIKGMEMPRNCAECPCRMIGYTKDHCNVLGKFIDFAVGSEGRREDCPLIEVPPHGDLVDRDEFITFIKSRLNSYYQWIIEMIEECPTVIPADKDGEAC